METIERPESVITGNSNLEQLYTFKSFPIFFGCVDEDESSDIKMDMSWAICPESGVIQLDKLVPLDILYRAQHFDGTGSTWKQYYEDFTDYIKAQSAKNVLEIGGGMGILAESFISKSQDTTWTIIEPNPVFKENQRIKIIRGFFDDHFKYSSQFDTIVHSQVLEHIYYPDKFIRSISNFLKPTDKMVFGYPNLHLYLSKKYTNTINFEHSIFLTDYFVDWLLIKHGFRIVDKTFYKEHIFCTVEKVSTPQKCPDLNNKYTEYKKIFTQFITYHKDLIQSLNNKIDSFEGEIYVFGAHVFSQYLFEFGLHKEKISGILDNSLLKQNKRLYGTPFTVYTLEVLKNKQRCAVILKVASYREEILKQLHEINPTVEIFE